MLKDNLPSSILRTVYFSLIESHIQYGLVIWGRTYDYILNPIRIQQKKALRIVDKKPYNHHSKPLFVKLKILPFDELYELIYRCYKNQCPETLSDLYVMNMNLHRYNTRASNMPHLFNKRTTPYFQSFLYNGTKLCLKLNKYNCMHFMECNHIGLFTSKLKRLLHNQLINNV